MAVDENTRLDLRRAFEELLGPALANVAMEAMPPLDYDQLASKSDVDHVRIEVRGELAQLRGELAQLRGELKSDIAELRTEVKGDIAELRTEVKGDIAELRIEMKTEIASLHLQMAKNLRTTVITQVGSMAAFAGFVVGVA